jgi:hypothetical protein
MLLLTLSRETGRVGRAFPAPEKKLEYSLKKVVKAQRQITAQLVKQQYTGCLIVLQRRVPCA